MANKRKIKKQIHQLCGALASELLSASCCINGFDQKRVGEIIERIAALQVTALSHCSFFFDKSAKDFENARAFRTARRSYNRKAFAKLTADTETETASILKEMNALLPQDVRDAVIAANKK